MMNDEYCTNRKSARSSTSGVTERVVSQFLTELDGIHTLKRVNIPTINPISLLFHVCS